MVIIFTVTPRGKGSDQAKIQLVMGKNGLEESDLLSRPLKQSRGKGAGDQMYLVTHLNSNEQGEESKNAKKLLLT